MDGTKSHVTFGRITNPWSIFLYVANALAVVPNAVRTMGISFVDLSVCILFHLSFLWKDKGLQTVPQDRAEHPGSVLCEQDIFSLIFAISFLSKLAFRSLSKSSPKILLGYNTELVTFTSCYSEYICKQGPV